MWYSNVMINEFYQKISKKHCNAFLRDLWNDYFKTMFCCFWYLICVHFSKLFQSKIGSTIPWRHCFGQKPMNSNNWLFSWSLRRKRVGERNGHSPHPIEPNKFRPLQGWNCLFALVVVWWFWSSRYGPFW